MRAFLNILCAIVMIAGMAVTGAVGGRFVHVVNSLDDERSQPRASSTTYANVGAVLGGLIGTLFVITGVVYLKQLRTDLGDE
jgi:predicted MFS family arabinose efflux permease